MKITIKNIALLLFLCGTLSMGYSNAQLFDALMSGNFTKVKKELAQDPNVDVNDPIARFDGSTPLIIAARALHKTPLTGYLSIVKYLVKEKGAQLDDQNYEGRTALIEAADFGNTDIAVYLINKGANVNACDKKGKTALYYAVEKRNVKLVKALLEVPGINRTGKCAGSRLLPVEEYIAKRIDETQRGESEEALKEYQALQRLFSQ
jgi:hypothetical protein